jgi:hypothetical protein
MALPIACDLSTFTPEERRREQELLAAFRTRYERAEERADGWRFLVPADAPALAALGELFALERRCCPFLTFRLEVEAGDLAVVDVVGAPEAKAVVASEFLRPATRA